MQYGNCSILRGAEILGSKCRIHYDSSMLGGGKCNVPISRPSEGGLIITQKGVPDSLLKWHQKILCHLQM